MTTETQPLPTDAERAEFEEMMRRETFEDLSRFSDGGYKSYEARVGWIAWQAARRAPSPVGVEQVGVARSMPGTDGFTMACFMADAVPIGTKLYTAEVLATGRVPLPSIASVEMIDAAMVEMRNIAPPLKRSECRQLIDAALGVAHGIKGGQHDV